MNTEAMESAARAVELAVADVARQHGLTMAEAYVLVAQIAAGLVVLRVS